jgi:hypothetical protein
VKATRSRALPLLPTRRASERTLLGFFGCAARLGIAAHHQDLPALGVDDLGAPVVAQPEAEIDAASQPFGEGDLAVAIEVSQWGRHFAFPRELDGPQAREEEEGNRKDEDESQQELVALQDSTR